MNRRNLMKLAPAALAAGAVPAVGMSGGVVAAEETPVMKLYRQWRITQAKTERAPRDMPDEGFDALVEAHVAIERQMMQEPAQDARDWVIKIAAWTDFGVFCVQDRGENEALWAEARTLIGGVV